MLLRLVLLLTLVPLVELYLLVWLTELWESFLLTVGLIVLTGILGATLARIEGLRVLAQIRERTRRGELPADELLDGVMILLAAALLVTPGLITDAVGFLVLIPFTRAPARNLLKRWLKGKVQVVHHCGHGPGEYRPIDAEPPPGFPPLEDEDGTQGGAR